VMRGARPICGWWHKVRDASRRGAISGAAETCCFSARGDRSSCRTGKTDEADRRRAGRGSGGSRPELCSAFHPTAKLGLGVRRGLSRRRPPRAGNLGPWGRGEGVTDFRAQVVFGSSWTRRLADPAGRMSYDRQDSRARAGRRATTSRFRAARRDRLQLDLDSKWGTLPRAPPSSFARGLSTDEDRRSGIPDVARRCAMTTMRGPPPHNDGFEGHPIRDGIPRKGRSAGRDWPEDGGNGFPGRGWLPGSPNKDRRGRHSPIGQGRVPGSAQGRPGAGTDGLAAKLVKYSRVWARQVGQGRSTSSFRQVQFRGPATFRRIHSPGQRAGCSIIRSGQRRSNANPVIAVRPRCWFEWATTRQNWSANPRSNQRLSASQKRTFSWPFFGRARVTIGPRPCARWSCTFHRGRVRLGRTARTPEGFGALCTPE